MDPTEVRQMQKHQQCVVVIDTSPPIKSAYPPYAVLKQRAIAIEYGKPKLVSLEDAEAEYQKVMKALGEVEATGEVTDALVATRAESSQIERETIDGGLDYRSDELTAKVAANAAEEGSGKESGGRRTRMKVRPPDSEFEHKQFKLYSDQGVEKQVNSSAEEELKKKKPQVTVRLDDGTSIAGGQMAGVLNSTAAVTAHDSLR